MLGTKSESPPVAVVDVSAKWRSPPQVACPACQVSDVADGTDRFRPVPLQANTASGPLKAKTVLGHTGPNKSDMFRPTPLRANLA